jgi:alanine dehydrogenase
MGPGSNYDRGGQRTLSFPRTSTFALNNATLPFTLALADKGARRALHEDAHLLNGLNVAAGKITNKAVAAAMNLPYTNPHNLIS